MCQINLSLHGDRKARSFLYPPSILNWFWNFKSLRGFLTQDSFIFIHEKIEVLKFTNGLIRYFKCLTKLCKIIPELRILKGGTKRFSIFDFFVAFWLPFPHFLANLDKRSIYGISEVSSTWLWKFFENCITTS